MTVQQLLPFLAVVAMITVTPGPDTALVVRNTLRGRLRDGVLTALGCSFGLLVWGVAAALGLATLMSTSATLFGMIRILGGAYLIWLGLRMVWNARRTVAGRGAASARLQPESGQPLLEGLLTDLLNPKAAAFFTALLPQFVTSTDAVLTTTLLLAAIAAVAAFLGFLAYAVLAARARAALGRPSLRRWLDRVTGMVLLGLGVRMLAHEVRA